MLSDEMHRIQLYSAPKQIGSIKEKIEILRTTWMQKSFINHEFCQYNRILELKTTGDFHSRQNRLHS